MDVNPPWYGPWVMATASHHFNHPQNTRFLQTKLQATVTLCWMDNSDGHANPIVYWGQHSASNHLTNKRTRGGYGKSQKPSDKDIFIFTYHGGWKHTKEIIEDADAEAIANLVDMSKKYYA